MSYLAESPLERFADGLDRGLLKNNVQYGVDANQRPDFNDVDDTSCAEDMMNELKATKARMDELKHQLSDMQRQTQDNSQALEGIDIILDKGKTLEVWSRPRLDTSP